MRYFKLLFTAAMLLSIFQLAPAAPGDLDLTFGGTGKVVAGFGGGQGKAYAVAGQPDGKLVLAGYQSTFNSQGGQFLVARFGTNSLLDPSFGTGGKVSTFLTTNFCNAQALAVQTDGKIVAAGYAYRKTTNSDFVLVRYNPNGSLDTTFGTNGNGIVYTDFGQQSQINAIAIQANGAIVAAGSLGYPGGGDAGIALARYQTNGVLDPTFGTGGVIATPGGEYDALFGMIIQLDQKILAVGDGGGADFAIYRFTTNGTPDTSFGGGTGHVFTDFGSSSTARGSSVAIQSGGITIGNPDKIVAAGTYNNYSGTTKNYQVLIRYGLDGTLDSTFGNGGIVTNLLGNGIVAPESVRVFGTLFDPRRIVVGGSYSDGASNYFALNRYNAAGVLDTTFGANNSGKASIPVSPLAIETVATAMTFQFGNLILAGYSGEYSGSYQFAAARFTSSGLVDTNFGNQGILLGDVADSPAQARAAALQTDGKIVAVGINTFLTNNSQYDRFALARFNSDGSVDPSFGKVGKTTLSFSVNSYADAYAVAIQSDGKIIAGGAENGGFALARFQSNGSLDTSFATNGMTSIQLGTGNGQINAVRIQPDGKILAGGYASSGTYPGFALARFTANGFPDPTFGSGGSVITSFSAPYDLGFGMGIQPDGKIALAGTAISINGTTLSGDFAAARYNTNGSLDFSFGSLGRASGNVGGGTLDVGYAMAIQPDGKIIVAGGAGLGNFPGPVQQNISANAFLALMRFNTNGTPDNSFGTGGGVITQVGAFSDFATSIVLQSDGKILVAGASQSGFYKFFALRYTANGDVDDSYGDSGAAHVDFGTGTNEIAYGLSLDSYGRAMLCGAAGNSFALARLQGDSIPSPLLKIFLTSTNTAVISWPYPSTGWNLKENTDQTFTSWTTPPESISNDGTNNFIVVSPTALNCFYRLQSP